MESTNDRAAAYRTFCRRWQGLLPSLVIMKPLSDLCWTCQRYSTAVQRATSSVLEKSAALQDYLEHLSTVTSERSFYTTVLKECKESITNHFTVDGTFSPPPLYSRAAPNSTPIKAQYSFDYAQQVKSYTHVLLQWAFNGKGFLIQAEILYSQAIHVLLQWAFNGKGS